MPLWNPLTNEKGQLTEIVLARHIFAFFWEFAKSNHLLREVMF
jgi:hypothetical protein